MPRPGHSDEYPSKAVTPHAWPTEEPTEVPLLPGLHAGEAHQPRRSDPIRVEGDLTVFYWCRACNRCLRHWRSAFCTTHRTAYKNARRRLRENKGRVSIDHATVVGIHHEALAHLRARERNDRDAATQHLRGLLDLAVFGVPESLRRD